MEVRWFSVDEIGDHIGIKPDTVCKWISEKRMQKHRMGRLWKFQKDEKDTWAKTEGAAESDHQPFLLSTRSFDHIFLFKTPSTQQITGETKEAIKKLRHGSEVHVLEISFTGTAGQ